MRYLSHSALAVAIAAGPTPSASPAPLAPAYVYMGTIATTGDCLSEGKRALHDAGYAAPDTRTANLLVAKRGGALGEWYCVPGGGAVIDIRSASEDATKALVADLIRSAGPSASPAPLAPVPRDDGRGPATASMAVEESTADAAACGILGLRVLRAAGFEAAADATGSLVLGRSTSETADILCGPKFVAIDVMGSTNDETGRELGVLTNAFTNEVASTRLVYASFGVVRTTGSCPDAGRRTLKNAGFGIAGERYGGQATFATRGDDFAEFICLHDEKDAAVVNVIGPSSAEVRGVGADLNAAATSAAAPKTLASVVPASGLGPTTASFGGGPFAGQTQAQCLAAASAIFARTGYAGATTTSGDYVIGVGATTTSEAVCLPNSLFLTVAGRSTATTDDVLQSIVLGLSAPSDAEKASATPAP